MNISQLILTLGKEENKSKEDLFNKVINYLKEHNENYDIYKIKCILNELIRYIKTRKKGKWRKLKVVETNGFRIIEKDKYDGW